MKLLISEILKKVEDAKGKEQKKALLKQYETSCLRGLMRINFDESVDMNLPKGTPPYKKDTDKPIGNSHSILEQEYRKFYIWLQPSNLSNTRKEQLFIHLLESLHYTEAEILCLVKDKNLRHRFPSITDDLIREVYEGVLPPKVAKKSGEDTVQPLSQVVREDLNIETTVTVTETDEIVVVAPKKRGRPKKVVEETQA